MVIYFSDIGFVSGPFHYPELPASLESHTVLTYSRPAHLLLSLSYYIISKTAVSTCQ